MSSLDLFYILFAFCLLLVLFFSLLILCSRYTMHTPSCILLLPHWLILSLFAWDSSYVVTLLSFSLFLSVYSTVSKGLTLFSLKWIVAGDHGPHSDFYLDTRNSLLSTSIAHTTVWESHVPALPMAPTKAGMN